MDKDVIIALISAGGVLIAGGVGALISFLATDRDSRRDHVTDSRQADAAEGQSVAALATQVLALTQRIAALEEQVGELRDDNRALKGRLTAAIAYISELLGWVEAGAHAPVPTPGRLIANDITLPAAWLNTTGEDQPRHPQKD